MFSHPHLESGSSPAVCLKQTRELCVCSLERLVSPKMMAHVVVYPSKFPLLVYKSLVR
jgi:hypothetical protein